MRPVVSERHRASAASIGKLTISVRRDIEWPPDDLASLDRLIDLRPHLGLFLSRPWLSGFFADPQSGEDLSIVEFREDGVLRGVIPLTIRRARGSVHIGLLGGARGSDRVDLLVARGFESRFADMFLDWIDITFGRDGFTLRLRDVPDDSPLWGGICRAMQERRIRLTLVPRQVNALPYIPLGELHDGAARDAWGNTSSMTKHRRWLEHRGALTIECARDADDALVVFERMTEWLETRWGARSATRPARAARFHRHVIPLLVAERPDSTAPGPAGSILAGCSRRSPSTWLSPKAQPTSIFSRVASATSTTGPCTIASRSMPTSTRRRQVRSWNGRVRPGARSRRRW
jgi:hypothetical protein